MTYKTLILLSCALILSACSSNSAADQSASSRVAAGNMPAQMPFMAPPGQNVAIVAGGCFWCVESDFEKLDGVSEVISGYTGGTLDNPNYKAVTYEPTGHREAAMIFFDPNIISYRALIDHYWMTIDPTDAGGQFCDRGESYQSAIFVTPQQRADAQASLDALLKSGKIDDVVTPILPAVTFYPAEDYHQNYYKTNALKYKYYRNGCGRDKRLERVWGLKK